jgi:hypothetical protein
VTPTLFPLLLRARKSEQNLGGPLIKSIVGLRWPFGKSFYTTVFALLYTWINTRKLWGFGFVQGFPFVYQGMQDSDPSLYFSGTSLALNLLVGSAAVALIWRFAPQQKVRCSWQESSSLALVAATFTWANLEVWYGWRPTLWGITHSHSPTATYGTPFVYMTDYSDGGVTLHPIWLGLNCLILCVVLTALSMLFHRHAATSDRNH